MAERDSPWSTRGWVDLIAHASQRIGQAAVPFTHMQKALSLFEKGPSVLVAGAGFEPATSGL